MYMNIREYRVPPGQMDELIRRIDLNWVDRARKLHGFMNYHVVRPEEDRLVSLTAFVDRDAAKRGAEASAEWVGERLMDLDVEFLEMREGDVVVHAGE